MEKGLDFYFAIIKIKKHQKTLKVFLKKTLRYTIYLTIIFFVLFGTLALLLQQSGIQTWTTQKATQYLSEKLDTKVEIGRVDIDFFKKVVLEEVYIEDLQKDTLLYAAKLKGDISLFSFWNQELNIAGVDLEGGRINLKRSLVDSTYNFQFLIDAFTPETPPDTSSVPWKFQLDDLQITQSKINLLDEVGEIELQTDIGDLRLNLNSLDLEKLQLDLSSADIQNTKIAYYLLPKNDLGATIGATNAGFKLPHLGLDLEIGELNLKGNQFIYRDRNTAIDSGSNYVNYTNLDLQAITGNLEHLTWTTQKIEMELHELTTKEANSGFYLKNLAANAVIDSSQLQLENLIFETPNSSLQTDVKLGFNGFEELNFSNENLEINAAFKKVDLAVSDVLQLAPQIANIQGFNAQTKEHIVFEGNLNGTLSNLQAENVKIQTANNTTLKLNGRMVGLPNVNDAQFDMRVNQLSSSYADLQKLLKGVALPEGLKQLGRMNISGSLRGNAGNFTAQNLKLTTSTSTVFEGDVKVEGANGEYLTFDIEAAKLNTTYEDILVFAAKEEQVPKVIGDWGILDLSGHFVGSLEDFEGREVRFYTEAKSPVFEGDIGIQNLLDIENANFDIKANKLQLTYPDLNGLAKGTLPNSMSNLGNMSYKGSFKGSIYEFYIKGRFGTSIGVLQTDTYLKFNKDYSFADYRTKSGLEEFEVGKLLGNKDIGEVSLKANIEGSGLNAEDLKADIDAQIESAKFRNYTYQKVAVDGKLKKGEFEGKVNSEDSNANLGLEGLFNFSEPNLVYQFEAHIDTLDLKKLGLLQQDLRIYDLELQSDLKGKDFNLLDGFVSAQNIHLKSDTLTFELDSIQLSLRQKADNRKKLSLQSDLIVAKIDGYFNPLEVPDMMLEYVNKHFDIAEFLDDSEDAVVVERPQTFSRIAGEEPIAPKFDFTLEAGNVLPLTQLFIPQLKQLDTLYLEGTFNEANGFLHFDSYIPKVVYGDLLLNGVELNTSGDDDEINLTFRINAIDIGSNIKLPQSILTAAMFDNRLLIGADIEGDTVLTKLQMEGEVLKLRPNRYQFSLIQDLLLNKKIWEVEARNGIVFGPKFLNIRDFTLRSGKEQLRINSKNYEDAQAPIKIDFTKFGLGEISNLLNMERLQFGGALNGHITLSEPLENLQFTSNLRVDSLVLNDLHLGNALMLVNQEGADKIAVNVNIAGGATTGSILGDYQIRSKRINLDIGMQQWKMALLDPFAVNLIEESEGTFSGKLALKGTLEAPNLTGRIKFEEASTVVAFSKTRYSLDNQELTFTENSIQLNNVVVKDQLEQSAMVVGRVWHQSFQDLRLDLRVETDNFHLLNTTIKDNDFYFGTIFMGANITVTGPVELMKIRGSARTMPGSTLYINQASESIGGGEESFVVFVDFSEMDSIVDTVNVADAVRPEINTNVTGFDILVNLDARTNAEMQLIIDPLSDDRIICRGEGNLTVEMTPLGDFYLTGRYTIDQGSYTFTYEGLFQRDFTVRKGGYIDFVGDLFDARMNLSAIYKLKTGTYDLIANEVSDLNSAEANTARRPTPVEVLMNLNGELLSPELTFDIELPQAQGSITNSMVLRKLDEIREEEAELNKQVFGLLLFQNFIVSQANADLATAGENIALSSVSSLITSQLNNLVGGFNKIVEIGITVDSHTSQYGDGSSATSTELQLELRKRFFNDRLTFELGSNVDLSGEQNVNADNAAVVGDFVVTYKLTEDGRYLIRAFSKRDFDVFSNSNVSENGGGISFRNSLKNKRKDH
ncbi:MAG: translocation/assembly module TamB domain-containing protein [Chitinophagales bacterium]